MTKSNYNFWFALTYELVQEFVQHFVSLRQNKIIKQILIYCKEDWVLWKTELTLKKIDLEVEQLKKDWEKEEPPKFLIIEHTPDGSKAQQLLGGEIEIKSTFKRE